MSQLLNELRYAADLGPSFGEAVGLEHGEPGVLRLGESLQPSLDIWSQPEWAFLRAERLGAGRSSQGAVAAEFSMIALGNAAGSNSLVVVEAIGVACPGSATSCFLEVVADSVIAGTLSAAAFFVSGRDRRFGSTQGRTFLKVGSDPGNTFGVQLEQISGGNTPGSPFNQSFAVPIVLRPGDDLVVIAQTVNINLQVNWKWRERRMFPSENAS